MNIKLRECEIQALFWKRSIDFLVDIILYIPVVCSFDPGLHCVLYITILHRIEPYKRIGCARCGGIQDSRVVFQDLHHGLLGLGVVNSVFQGDEPFQAVDLVLEVILDIAVRERSVRQNDGLVVECPELCAYDIDF